MSDIKFYIHDVPRVEMGQFLNSLFELREKHRSAGGSTFIEWVETNGDNYDTSGYFATKSDKMARDLAVKMVGWWPWWDPIASKIESMNRRDKKTQL